MIPLDSRSGLKRDELTINVRMDAAVLECLSVEESLNRMTRIHEVKYLISFCRTLYQCCVTLKGVVTVKGIVSFSLREVFIVISVMVTVPDR